MAAAALPKRGSTATQRHVLVAGWDVSIAFFRGVITVAHQGRGRSTPCAWASGRRGRPRKQLPCLARDLASQFGADAAASSRHVQPVPKALVRVAVHAAVTRCARGRRPSVAARRCGPRCGDQATDGGEPIWRERTNKWSGHRRTLGGRHVVNRRCDRRTMVTPWRGRRAVVQRSTTKKPRWHGANTEPNERLQRCRAVCGGGKNERT